MNDAMALGAFKAVREAGKKVPDDYSIVGFDDLVFADSVDPALTTVGLEQYLWGKKLAQYYFSLLEHPEVKESCVSEEEVLVKSKEDRLNTSWPYRRYKQTSYLLVISSHMFCTPHPVCKKIRKMENDFHIFFTHCGKRFPHKIKAMYSDHTV